MAEAVEAAGEAVALGVRVWFVAGEGAPLADRGRFMDVVGDALGAGAGWAAVPVGRLSDDFFRLRTGLAGELSQAFVNYGVGLAVVGDVSAHVEASTAFRDWVRECDRGRHVWFAPDLPALAARLAA